MTGVILASFFLGIFVCIVFYLAVILPFINELDSELEKYMINNNHLQDVIDNLKIKNRNQKIQLYYFQKNTEELKKIINKNKEK